MNSRNVAEESEPYLRIVQDIENKIISGALTPGSRLPSENQLVKMYRENVYNIRKAVMSLKAKGHLYSKPKLGVFVAAAKRTGIVEQTTRITLSTRSIRPIQKKIWQRLSEVMANSFEHSVLEMIYPSQLEHHAPGADIYEISGLGTDCFSTQISFIPLRKYFSGVLPTAEQMKNDYFVPFGYAPLNLYFNRNLLKKLHMQEPVFSNYDEQLSWLEETAEKTAESPDLMFPASAAHPFLLLGGFTGKMFSELEHNEIDAESFWTKYRELFHHVTEFRRKYRSSRTIHTGEKIKFFLEGRMPCFSTIGDLPGNVPKGKFESGSAMMYAADDRCPMVPLLFAVSEKTEHPVECVRLIRMLSGKEYQQGLSDAGFIPASDLSILPHMDYPVPLEKRVPFQPTGKEEYYVLLNILNVELNNVILADKSLDAAIRDYYLFSSAYLNMRKNQTQMNVTNKTER